MLLQAKILYSKPCLKRRVVEVSSKSPAPRFQNKGKQRILGFASSQNQ